MPEFAWRWLLARRVHGNAAWISWLLRIGCGVFFFFAGIPKFSDHDAEVEDFERWDVPAAEAAVYLAGFVEIIAGLMLLFGLLTRVAALALIADMVVAILTAGRHEGFGFHTTVPPVLILVLLFLGYAGGGPVSVDRVMARRPGEVGL